jgi:hypothetical protein
MRTIGPQARSFISARNEAWVGRACGGNRSDGNLTCAGATMDNSS